MADEQKPQPASFTVSEGHNIFKLAPRPGGERGHNNYIPEAALTKSLHFFALPIIEDDARRSGGDCICTIQTCSANGCGFEKPIRVTNQSLSQGDFDTAFFAFGRVSPFFIGSMCAAGCTTHCVMGANNPNEAVSINFNEQALEEHGWKHNLFPKLFEKPAQETGKKVTIIGGGIAGLTAAWEARKQGHEVTIIEKSDQLGGLMTEGKGIPPWKSIRNFGQLQQMLIDMGVQVRLGTEVGKDVDIRDLQKESDALVIATGVVHAPNDIKIPGRDAEGVVQAMDFFRAQQQSIKEQVQGDVTAYDFGRERPHEAPGKEFDFTRSPMYFGDKTVLVYGGGLTGEDALAWVSKQIAAERERDGGSPGTVTTIIRQPEPGEAPARGSTWPNESEHFRMTTQLKIAAQVAGVQYNPRTHDTSIDEILKDEAGKVRGVKVTVTEWPKWLGELDKEERRRVIKEKDIKPVRQESFEMKADAIILALGFKPFHSRPPEFTHGLEITNDQGQIEIHHGRTKLPGVYVVGDAATMVGDAPDWVLHAAGGQARKTAALVSEDIASGAAKSPEKWEERYRDENPFTPASQYKSEKLAHEATSEMAHEPSQQAARQ